MAIACKNIVKKTEVINQLKLGENNNKKGGRSASWLNKGGKSVIVQGTWYGSNTTCSHFTQQEQVFETETSIRECKAELGKRRQLGASLVQTSRGLPPRDTGRRSRWTPTTRRNCWAATENGKGARALKTGKRIPSKCKQIPKSHSSCWAWRKFSAKF